MPKPKPHHHPVLHLRFAVPQNIEAILELEITSFACIEESLNRRQVRRTIANSRAIALIAESKDE